MTIARQMNVGFSVALIIALIGAAVFYRTHPRTAPMMTAAHCWADWAYRPCAFVEPGEMEL